VRERLLREHRVRVGVRQLEGGQKLVVRWAGRPDELEKKTHKMWPNPFLPQWINNFFRGKIRPQNWPIYVIFKKIAQRKQSPVRRKFAQSGHPEDELLLLASNHLVKLSRSAPAGAIQSEFNGFDHQKYTWRTQQHN
jgi:hypothetical protein